MARQRRHTEPLATLHGTLTNYAEIDRYLLEGEYKGRAWIFERARTATLLSTYDDHDIRELHRAMFGDLLDWAGQFRTTDVGPGGKVPVPWFQVPVATRVFADNLRARVLALPDEPTLVDMAEIVADAHHGFQKIHPFRDTNGRTGRVLDLYFFWVTFGFKRSSLALSPVIEPFPTSADEDEYYEGLAEADEHQPERLRLYYLARMAKLFVGMTFSVP